MKAERNTLIYQAFAIGAVPEKTVETTDKVVLHVPPERAGRSEK
jgi:hypothetical protein